MEWSLLDDFGPDLLFRTNLPPKIVVREWGSHMFCPESFSQKGRIKKTSSNTLKALEEG